MSKIGADEKTPFLYQTLNLFNQYHGFKYQIFAEEQLPRRIRKQKIDLLRHFEFS
jgi:hypothetical protein